MGTPYKKVYEAFLSRIENDEWAREEDFSVAEEDWKQLLKQARTRFLFPRISILGNDELGIFDENLTTAEIEVLATFMKHEWLKRCLASWRLIRQQYHTKDFEFASQANHMSKLQDAVKLSNQECRNFMNNYSRSINHTVFNWKKFAGSGGKNERV